MAKLQKLAEKTAKLAYKMIDADSDKSEPGSLWRILNLNHGIIAYITHNITIMNHGFIQRVLCLPNGATNYITSSMKQMDIIGYPEHIKHVMV